MLHCKRRPGPMGYSGENKVVRRAFYPGPSHQVADSAANWAPTLEELLVRPAILQTRIPRDSCYAPVSPPTENLRPDVDVAKMPGDRETTPRGK